jgi:hypothetical protein
MGGSIMETGWDIGSFSFFLPVTFIVIVIAVLAAVIARRNVPNGSSLFSPGRLVECYVYTVLLVSMIIASAGIADLVRAGLARKMGLESSYRPTPVWDENREKIAEPKYELDQKSPRRDLISGSAELGVGLLLGVSHIIALRRTRQGESLTASPVYRVFLVAGLVIYTTAVLIYAVGSINDLLLFRYVGQPPLRSWVERPLPGDQIARLLAFVPFWSFLVGRVFRDAKSRAATA